MNHTIEYIYISRQSSMVIVSLNNKYYLTDNKITPIYEYAYTSQLLSYIYMCVCVYARLTNQKTEHQLNVNSRTYFFSF